MVALAPVVSYGFRLLRSDQALSLGRNSPQFVIRNDVSFVPMDLKVFITWFAEVK